MAQDLSTELWAAKLNFLHQRYYTTAPMKFTPWKRMHFVRFWERDKACGHHTDWQPGLLTYFGCLNSTAHFMREDKKKKKHLIRLGILRYQMSFEFSTGLFTYFLVSALPSIKWLAITHPPLRTHLIQDNHRIFSRCWSGYRERGSGQRDIRQSPLPDTGTVIWDLKGAAFVIV